MPDLVLGIWDTTVNKIDKTSCPGGIYTLVEKAGSKYNSHIKHTTRMCEDAKCSGKKMKQAKEEILLMQQKGRHLTRKDGWDRTLKSCNAAETGSR